MLNIVMDIWVGKESLVRMNNEGKTIWRSFYCDLSCLYSDQGSSQAPRIIFDDQDTVDIEN